MSLRKIKLISNKKGYEVNVSKHVVTNVLGSDGKIEKIPNILFEKDPRGNWLFTPSAKGGSEFVLQETEDWVNTTPTVVDAEIARRSPGIDKWYGPIVPYVSLEEALVAFLKQFKPLIIGREFAVVYEQGLEDVIKCIVDNGWPTERIENYTQYLEAMIGKPKDVEPEADEDTVNHNEIKRKTARQIAKEAKDKELQEVK